MPDDPVSMLLADEHLPDKTTFKLRRLGHDVKRMRDYCVNKAGDGHSDIDVLQLAIAEGRAVVTENWPDFKPLHASDPGHNGIIGTNQFDDETAQAKAIDKAIREVIQRHGSLSGKFLRVPLVIEDPSKPEPLKKKPRNRA